MPELRTSGNPCLSVAFANYHVVELAKWIKKRISSVENASVLSALGLSSKCQIAMTEQQLRSLKDIAAVTDRSNDGTHRDWLCIQDDTAVDRAHRGAVVDEEAPDPWFD